MSYENIILLIDRRKSVKVTELTRELENLYYNAQFEGMEIECYDQIYSLIDLALEQPKFVGDDSDFHNLSVTCAKRDDFDEACRFIKRGLEYFPYSVDLLADYLSYGVKCQRSDECVDIYKRLCDKRKFWNWRAYQFSIDYLENLHKTGYADYSQEIWNLIKEFIEKKPDAEEGYLAKADYLKQFPEVSDSENFESVLNYVTSDKSELVRTPKCDLKMADYLYDCGKDIDKILALLDKCKKDSTEVQPSVNRSYVYILTALCKITQFYNQVKEKESKHIDEYDPLFLLIQQIYENYHVAALNNNDKQVRNVKTLIESLVRETAVSYPYGDDVDNNI